MLYANRVARRGNRHDWLGKLAVIYQLFPRNSIFEVENFNKVKISNIDHDFCGSVAHYLLSAFEASSWEWKMWPLGAPSASA